MTKKQSSCFFGTLCRIAPFVSLPGDARLFPSFIFLFRQLLSELTERNSIVEPATRSEVSMRFENAYQKFGVSPTNQGQKPFDDFATK